VSDGDDSLTSDAEGTATTTTSSSNNNCTFLTLLWQKDDEKCSVETFIQVVTNKQLVITMRNNKQWIALVLVAFTFVIWLVRKVSALQRVVSELSLKQQLQIPVSPATPIKTSGIREDPPIASPQGPSVHTIAGGPADQLKQALDAEQQQPNNHGNTSSKGNKNYNKHANKRKRNKQQNQQQNQHPSSTPPVTVMPQNATTSSSTTQLSFVNFNATQ